MEALQVLGKRFEGRDGGLEAGEQEGRAWGDIEYLWRVRVRESQRCPGGGG